MEHDTPLFSLLETALGATGDELLNRLSGSIVTRNRYRPFPDIDERDDWERLDSDHIRHHIAAGDEALDFSWPALLAERYLDFGRNGNRTRFAAIYDERRRRLNDLVYAECCRNDGRYLDQIANGIWLICEESSWCIPAHINAQRDGIDLPEVTEPIVDLFAAETAAALAWLSYLLGDRLDGISPLINRRIKTEIQRRILAPYAAREDFFWMGFGGIRVNNWNPWINSNILAITLLVEPDPDVRAALVLKSVRSVDHFLGPYPSDGGCDEGPSYWGRAGASLFDYLELLDQALQGKYPAFDLPIVKEIGRFIYRVHIDRNQFVNFADAPAVVALPGELIERYGRRINDPVMASFGSWICRPSKDGSRPAGTSPGRHLPVLFRDGSADAAPPSAPLLRDSWLDEIEVVTARDAEETSEGFFIAAKGGHNDESHNHNDIGSFIVYIDGKPVLVDAGVETYRRETFNEKRYTIWTMQSAYHTLLPTIDGVMQAPGRQFRATDVRYEATDSKVEFGLDIASAYPSEAGIEAWRRIISLRRGEAVDIVDDYRLRTTPGELVLSILTPCVVSETDEGILELSAKKLPSDRLAGDGVFRYDPGKFALTVERIEIEDRLMLGNWGAELTRLVFSAIDPQPRGVCTFSVTRSR